VASAVGMLRIRTFGPTREYMPRDSLARSHLETLERHFPGTVTMTELHEGPPESTKSLPVLRHIAALQEEMERSPLEVRTESEANLVNALHQPFVTDDPHPYSHSRDQRVLSHLHVLRDS